MAKTRKLKQPRPVGDLHQGRSSVYSRALPARLDPSSAFFASFRSDCRQTVGEDGRRGRDQTSLPSLATLRRVDTRRSDSSHRVCMLRRPHETVRPRKRLGTSKRRCVAVRLVSDVRIARCFGPAVQVVLPSPRPKRPTQHHPLRHSPTNKPPKNLTPMPASTTTPRPPQPRTTRVVWVPRHPARLGYFFLSLYLCLVGRAIVLETRPDRTLSSSVRYFFSSPSPFRYSI